MNGTTLTIRGNVNIILCDGADVRIKDGIEVKTGYSLTIYGQSGDSGKLYAVNNSGDAGIGCGPNSGVGDITIHGGVIESHGGKYAAGIGSGDERQMGSHITIFGGDIKAFGGDYGAGIGSGDETGGDNGYIDIYGGTIYARGGTDGAGIGGGNEGNSRNITIWGGKVTAESGSNQASGIGGGDDGSSAGVELYDTAKVTAGSSSDAAALQTADKRSAGLKMRYAKIEPCNHPKFIYTMPDDIGHYITCENCSYSKYESHIFDSSDVCVCGMEKTASTLLLSFTEKREGDDYNYIMFVKYGTNYTLHQPEYSSGRDRFDGWKIGETTE